MAWAHSQKAFVEKKLGEEPAPTPFAMGSVLPVLGEDVKIVPGLKLPGLLEGGELAIAPANERLLAKRIEALLRRVALEAAERELRDAWRQLGVPDAPVSVRSYKRRWGACGNDGATALNWRLIFAPRSVLGYVAVHEAAHRLEMNHGPKFWEHVARLMPHYRQEEAWLRTHGGRLYGYGAAANAS